MKKRFLSFFKRRTILFGCVIAGLLSLWAFGSTMGLIFHLSSLEVTGINWLTAVIGICAISYLIFAIGGFMTINNEPDPSYGLTVIIAIGMIPFIGCFLCGVGLIVPFVAIHFWFPALAVYIQKLMDETLNKELLTPRAAIILGPIILSTYICIGIALEIIIGFFKQIGKLITRRKGCSPALNKV